MAVATVFDTAPSSPGSGALWLDTSGAEAVLRVWTGSVWVRATPEAGDTPAGSSLSLAALGTALRADYLDTDIAGILGRLGAVADALVTLYAPDAPDGIRQEAAIRVAGYLYDQPNAGEAGRYSSAWRNSGAAALVSPWVSRRLGIVGGDPDSSTDNSSRNGGGRQVDYFAW